VAHTVLYNQIEEIAALCYMSLVGKDSQMEKIAVEDYSKRTAVDYL
jgi:hypothetical protein